MPDRRKHRGPHPADEQLFSPQARPALQAAAGHLSWLLTRGYAPVSALKLVGDRFGLAERQRKAVMRCACPDQALDHRRESEVPRAELAGQRLLIDGFNLLTTVEAALSGCVILQGRDGCFRDMASMHGSYRKVEETRPAVVLIGEVLQDLVVAECCWYLDSPVSNSGRLSTILRAIAADHGWNWRTQLTADPDAVLSASDEIVASADSVVLDRCRLWFNLAREVVRRVPDAWVVPLQDAT